MESAAELAPEPDDMPALDGAAPDSKEQPSADRRELLEKLRAEVRSGIYQVDSKRLAQALIKKHIAR